VREEGEQVGGGVRGIEVKSSIARRGLGEVVPAKNQHRVFGAAWMGEGEITKVDVSTDGGKTWSAATLLDKPVKYAWRLWEYIWKTPDRPGKYTLMSRATAKAENGREIVQPMTRNTDFRNYAVHHVVPVEVEGR